MSKEPMKRPSKATPARIAALRISSEARKRDAFARELLDANRASLAKLSPEDKAFSNVLVLGVVSCVGTIDELINCCLNSPSDVQDDVRDALRISFFELFFLKKSPHAVVDQGVELVRYVQYRAARLANHVLRKAVELLKAFPFGNPNNDIEAFARTVGFPVWLAKMLADELGNEGARVHMTASNEQAPLFIAVNSIKSSDDEVLSVLDTVGSDAEPVTFFGSALPGAFRVLKPSVISDGRVRHLFVTGKALVADAASQAVASIAVPDSLPETFLEIGSGRATKTILMQSNAHRRFGEQMKLYAMDSHDFKTKILMDRVKTYGASVEKAYANDARHVGQAVGSMRFDAALLDVPCSGLGTIRRHPEIKWRCKSTTMKSLAAEGLAMLESTSEHMRSGSVMTYATCTITSCENAQVVTTFLKKKTEQGFSLLPIDGKGCFATSLQPGGCDAHFAARIGKA